MPPRTNEPCSCYTIAQVLEELDLSLGEDGIFVWDTFPDPHVLVYCSRCGGRFPSLWNSRISDEERDRLQEIIDSISTVEDVIEKLGPPDYDSVMRVWVEEDGKLVYNEQAAYFDAMMPKTRNIEYYHVSEAANLEFYFNIDPGGESQKPGAVIVLKLTEEDRRYIFPEPEDRDPGEEPPSEVS